MNGVRGFKVFRSDWTCSVGGNTKHYTCPGKFEEEGELGINNHGMHFCENAVDCFKYYLFDANLKIAEVVAYGTVLRGKNQSCTDKLEVVREVPWYELMEIVNEGKNCTGLRNTGNNNTGNGNSGDSNTGHSNTGLANSGNQNRGFWNTGNCNTGSRNSGDCNTGNANTGNRNKGYRNTGDWNDTDFSSGCFNTKEQKMILFNKPSDWTYRDWLDSYACDLLNQIPKNVVKWVWSEDMTQEEKEQHPSYKTMGGYLKVLDESECGQIWWGSLKDRQKEIIKAIPNFDPDIFEQCTGIKVDD